MWPKNFTYICIYGKSYPPYILFIFEETKTSQIPKSTRRQLYFALTPPSLAFQDDCMSHMGFLVSWIRASSLPARDGATQSITHMCSRSLCWHHKWAALGPALGWTGIRPEPEPSLHRKGAILHQRQVVWSLIRAGSSPSSSQATEVCWPFLCINSSPSDPPPKGWHFYSCFSGKASLPFLKQHVQKLQATAFSDCLLLPGKWGV